MQTGERQGSPWWASEEGRAVVQVREGRGAWGDVGQGQHGVGHVWCEGGCCLSETEAGSEVVSRAGECMDFEMSVRHLGRSIKRANEIIKLYLLKYFFLNDRFYQFRVAIPLDPAGLSRKYEDSCSFLLPPDGQIQGTLGGGPLLSPTPSHEFTDPESNLVTYCLRA